MEQISDWMFVQNGKLVGGYTSKVLRNRMSAQQRRQFGDETTTLGFEHPYPVLGTGLSRVSQSARGDILRGLAVDHPPLRLDPETSALAHLAELPVLRGGVVFAQRGSGGSIREHSWKKSHTGAYHGSGGRADSVPAAEADTPERSANEIGLPAHSGWALVLAQDETRIQV